MSEGASIADVVTASLLAEGIAKGYKVDEGTPAGIQRVQEGHAVVTQPSVRGAMRVPASARPDLATVAPLADVVDDNTEVVEGDERIEFTPELPDDIKELLEDDDEPEEDNYREPVADDDDSLSYEDELTKLRRENAKLAKKAEFADKQKAEAQKTKWTAEVEKFFPLATPSTITADSRRGFLRAAEAQHNAVAQNPLLRRYTEQAVKDAQAQAEQILADARTQAAASWGRPVAGPGLVPVQDGIDQDALAKARKSGDLATVIGHVIGNIPGRR